MKKALACHGPKGCRKGAEESVNHATFAELKHVHAHVHVHVYVHQHVM